MSRSARRFPRSPLAGAALALMTVALWAGLSISARSGEGDPIAEVRVPDVLSDEARIGKRIFDARCATCHGQNAAGRDGFGPPLVHRIYEPGHHGDFAFLRAVRQGARQHHWRFGDMPPQEGLTDGDVKMIVRYVREMQRANGID